VTPHRLVPTGNVTRYHWVVFQHEPTDPQTVADELGIARSTVEWHLGRLIEQEVIVKEHDERNHVTLVVNCPDRMRTLLEGIAPSIPDRFIDRFTRLVDNLLSK
jgi:DNA-binding MarR family transcriptional regulator